MAAIQSRLNHLRYRRVIATTITLALVWLTWILLTQVQQSLGDVAMASGWTLLAGTMGMYTLGLRKASVSAILGPVAAWLQVHTYLGLFTLMVFVYHVGWSIQGRFELVLASTFLFISLSGIVLLWYSRRIPKLLQAVRFDVRLEDIPGVQNQLASTAHQIVLKSTDSAAGATLADFYQRRLLKYFHAPRNLFYRLIPNGRLRRQLLRELDDLDRYLDEPSRVYRIQLAELIVRKDDTDFHRALQLRLRWLVTCHVAMTWSLWLMIAVHIVLVLRFQGSSWT